MIRQQTPPGPVAFGRFIFDAGRRTLFLDGKPVVLQGKAFELLSILVTNRRVPVSREDLYEQLWPNGVVEDGNLTQSVYLLRRALDPFGSGRAFVETLPRFGYRFAMPVYDVQQRSSPGSALPRQIRLGGAMAAAFALILLGGSAVQPAHSQLNPQASVPYSLGLYHINMRSRTDLRQSVGYFTQTVREAPQSALGYAGLASAFALEAEFENAGSPEYKRDLALAVHNRDEALAHDANSTEAHTVAAFLAYRFEDNPVIAEREFRLAFDADPRNASAHHWHAIFLFSRGAINAAAAEWELAHQLDPTSEVISRWLGRAYFYQRRPNDAIRALSDTIMIEPADAPAWLSLASAQEQRGDLRDALRSLETVRRRMPFEDAFVIPDEARVRLLLSHSVDDRRAAEQINRLVAVRRVDPVESALYYIALGSRDRAIAELRTAHPRSPMEATLEKFDPRFEAVRADPRFQKLFD